jgi:hypothetical protein
MSIRDSGIEHLAHAKNASTLGESWPKRFGDVLSSVDPQPVNRVPKWNCMSERQSRYAELTFGQGRQSTESI